MSLLLMILDGFGIAEADKKSNAIVAANTPNFDKFWQEYPHTELSASGLDVGLPEGQMGNSEVGHLHIGAGRLVLQDLTKIDLAVESGEFFKNSALIEAVEAAKEKDGALHILGLLSPGGVHSRDTHLQAMAELAVKRGLKKVHVHALLDGRDTPPRSALGSIQAMEEKLKQLGVGSIATIGGRYYGMDRDKRWDRVKKAYDLFTLGETEFRFASAKEALEAAYARDENDEFVMPTAICASDANPITVQDGDSVVFMNFRADRARELSYAFTNPEFNDFERRAVPKLSAYTTLTHYSSGLKVNVAYPPEDLKNVLGEVLEEDGLTQLRIAETEKYAHVTYFINGGREKPFINEGRELIPSPQVATYDLQPEMSAPEVTEKLVKAIESKKYDVIICNYANPDMVGHTGDFAATVKALEVVDECLGKVVNAMQKQNGDTIIIADHGNAEHMLDEENQQAFTAHTTNHVPFIYIGHPAKITKQVGKLTDVAPTVLHLLDIAKPKEMTGESLIER